MQPAKDAIPKEGFLFFTSPSCQLQVANLRPLPAWLQVPVFACGIETRAGFVRVQVLVPHDESLGISPVQVFEQGPQCRPLRFGPGVCRRAVF